MDPVGSSFDSWLKQEGILDEVRQATAKVFASRGNVFADLGFAEPEEELMKAQLAAHIRRIIKRRRLTQLAAAGIMSIDQPKVSALLNGRLANFSSDRLMRFLNALGQDVEIVRESQAAQSRTWPHPRARRSARLKRRVPISIMTRFFVRPSESRAAVKERRKSTGALLRASSGRGQVVGAIKNGTAS
jgi:predicted XRE-type DNA-binding protein